MNDDRRDPPDDDHEPHGVVETIREEIEDAVEHVPQPLRWTVGKLARLISLVFAGLVVLGLLSAALYFMNRTELVARELTLLLNRTLRDHSDLVLDLRDIRGNPFTGFRAIEPRVRFRDGRTLLAAREMKVDYSAWSLLRGSAGTIDVVLEHPSVQLSGADGKWRLPVWRAGPARGKPGAARPLQLHLRVRDATVTTPKPYGTTTGLDLDLSAVRAQDIRVRLERLRWSKGPWDSRLERMAAELIADRSGVRTRVTELRSADLELRADGVWRAGATVRQLHVAVGRVRWRWLARVFDNRAFDVPGDGAFVLDGEGDRDWRGRFRATLEWDGLDAEASGIASWRGQELKLDSLVGHSSAGDLVGSLVWSRAGWQVAGDARRADPANWHALQLNGWPRGDLNGWFRYRVDTRGEAVAVLEARLGSSEWQGWHADSTLVRVDFPAQAADSFVVFGTRRGGHFTLHGRSDRAGWSGPYTIQDLPLEEWPDGRATGLSGVLSSSSGRVESRAGALFVTGELEGRDTHWASAAFSRWSLLGVHGRLLPTPDLVAQATTSQGYFLGVHLDSVAAPLVLGDRVVRFTPLIARAGDTTFVMTGQAAWDGASWWMTLPSAEMVSSQFHFRAEPPVRLSGDGQGAMFDRLVANDRDTHVEAHGRWAAPGGPYDFEFTGQRLDLARVGMPPDWGLGGRADVRLTVQGRSGDPRWRFEARTRAPAFAQHAADSLWLVLSGGPHRLALEDARFDLGGGTLRAAGEVDRAVAAFPDSLSQTAVVRWLRAGGTWRGRFAATDLPVVPLARVMPSANGWDGRVSGTLALSGQPAEPVLEVDANARQFGWHDLKAERVDLRAHYERGRLEVEDLRAQVQNLVSSVRLSLPLHLALGDTPSVPEEPIRGHIEIPAGDLQILPLIVPQLQYARGKFDLAAEVSGTPRDPRLAGKGHIRSGLVRPINRSEVLEGLGADLHFDQNRVTLDTLWAHQGRTGRVWSKGAVVLERGHLKNYHFDLAMRDFAAAEEGLYAVLFDGDFQVSDGPRVGGERLPQVTGAAHIKRGVIEFDFANQSEVQKRAATTQPLYWTYQIKAEATSNLRWRPQDADLEFNADLDLQQTPDSLLIYGEMHALRGTYRFLSNRFRILNADVTFDNQQGVDPVLDIAAQTRVRRSTAGAPGASRASVETITAQLTGRSSKPVISLTSSAQNADQQSILAALTYGSFRDDFGNVSARSASDPLDNYFTRQLNSQLSAGLSEFFRGAISDWELQYDKGGVLLGEGALVVGVGSQVTDKLAFRYRQRVPGLDRPIDPTRLDPTTVFEQNVEAEYRVNRFIYLTSGVSRRRNSLANPAQPNTDYNLNLKARWEY
jgi:hypothetical protein